MFCKDNPIRWVTNHETIPSYLLLVSEVWVPFVRDERLDGPGVDVKKLTGSSRWNQDAYSVSPSSSVLGSSLRVKSVPNGQTLGGHSARDTLF